MQDIRVGIRKSNKIIIIKKKTDPQEKFIIIQAPVFNFCMSYFGFIKEKSGYT